MDEKLTFWDHLEELRKRIIYAFLGIFGFSVVGYILSSKILEIIAKPVGYLYFFSPVEAFYTRIKIAFLFGVGIGIPWILLQFWLFVEPGLKPEEKKYGVPAIISSTLLFFLGVLFGYFVVIPAGIKFLLSFGTQRVVHLLNLSSYFNFVLWLLVACGVFFLMPVIMFFLARIGIINPSILKRRRREAMVFIVIISAVITPSVDAFTLLLVTVPIFLLYEISILVATIAHRK